jgi:hypothetical protein
VIPTVFNLAVGHHTIGLAVASRSAGRGSSRITFNFGDEGMIGLMLILLEL